MQEGGSDAILSKALKDLMMHWDRSEMTWKDKARSDFERDNLHELEPAVHRAVGAIQKIEEILRQARKDCS